MANFTDQDKQNLIRLTGDGPKSFTRLYSAKEDGCDAAVFHAKCDNKGPTVTLVFNTLGEVYGGYASMNWMSLTDKFVYDKNSFLFLLKSDKDKTEPKKFAVKTPHEALLMDTSNGPTFGTDLQVFTGNIPKEDDATLCLNSKLDPKAYENCPESLGDFISNDFTVNDVRVYAVDDVVQSLMEMQWRAEPSFDNQYLKTLLDDVETYWPLKDMGVSEDALQHVNILLIGPIGAGKSSFLNSVESVFRGHVTMSAAAGNRDKSVTSSYRQYPITASDNRHYLRFQLCDCRGLEDGFNLSRDVEAILEGHMPNNYIFNSSAPLTSKAHGFRREPRLKDKIHCVVYVLDSEKYNADAGISFVTEGVREQIMDIQDKVDQKGIPQLILLNKIDNACPATKEDISAVYRSSLIQQRCFHAANCLGLPPLTVLPMKNHYMELATSEDVSVLALYNIRQMLRACDSYLRVNHLDELRADKYETQLS